MRDYRILILAGGLAAAVVLFLVLRPGGDDGDAVPVGTVATQAETTATTEPETATGGPETEPETEPPTETAPETTAPETTPPETTAPTETQPAGPRTIAVVVRGGKPVGGIARATVAKGERVRLVVRSDVADHVHLHGYDILANVAPNQPAQLVFTASIPGSFEAELEDRRLQIAEIRVRP